MKLNTLRSWAPAVLAALALTACGGSDYIDLPPAAQDPTMVPASATANATAFSNYVASLPASDSADPLTVSALAPPVSDTDEPVAVTR